MTTETFNRKKSRLSVHDKIRIWITVYDKTGESKAIEENLEVFGEGHFKAGKRNWRPPIS